MVQSENGVHSSNVKCDCGEVSFKVTGDPVLQVFCHCQDCRQWFQFGPDHPVPVAIFPDESIEIESGEAKLKQFSLKKPEMSRPFCKECGHKFGNKHSEFPYQGFLATDVPHLNFKPQAHVYCCDASETSLKPFKNDGLPKFAKQQPIAGGDGKKVDV